MVYVVPKKRNRSDLTTAQARSAHHYLQDGWQYLGHDGEYIIMHRDIRRIRIAPNGLSRKWPAWEASASEIIKRSLPPLPNKEEANQEPPRSRTRPAKSYRRELEPFEGQRLKFVGTVTRVGRIGNMMMMINVDFADSMKPATNHLWFTVRKRFNDAFKTFGIQRGDRLMFYARVKRYHKNEGTRYDFCLVYPTQFEPVGKVPIIGWNV